MPWVPKALYDSLLHVHAMFVDGRLVHAKTSADVQAFMQQSSKLELPAGMSAVSPEAQAHLASFGQDSAVRTLALVPPDPDPLALPRADIVRKAIQDFTNPGTDDRRVAESMARTMLRDEQIDPRYIANRIVQGDVA